MPNLTQKLTGLLFGDKGYIKKDLFRELFDRGLKLVTSIKKGMKNSLMALNEKILLRGCPQTKKYVVYEDIVLSETNDKGIICFLSRESDGI